MVSSMTSFPLLFFSTFQTSLELLSFLVELHARIGTLFFSTFILVWCWTGFIYFKINLFIGFHSYWNILIIPLKFNIVSDANIHFCWVLIPITIFISQSDHDFIYGRTLIQNYKTYSFAMYQLKIDYPYWPIIIVVI